MRDSVPSGSYSSVCNVLRQWKSLSSLLIESTDSMIIESTDSMITCVKLRPSPIICFCVFTLKINTGIYYNIQSCHCILYFVMKCVYI